MAKQRVALYLQDAHDLREGLSVCQYAEAKGFEAVWQAEIAARAGCHRSHGRLRGGDHAPQGRVWGDQ